MHSLGHVILGTVAGYIVAFIAFVLGAGWTLSFVLLAASGTIVALGSAIWSVAAAAPKKALKDKADARCGEKETPERV